MSWCKGTKIIINIITKIFRNFNIKKNFYISCIFSSSISNTYTYLKITAQARLQGLQAQEE